MKTKSFFSIKILLLFLLSIVLTTGAVAQNQLLKVGSGQLQNETVLMQQSDNKTAIQFKLNEMALTEVTTDYGKAALIASNKAPLILEKGAPELFYLTATFVIPDKGDSQLEITYGNFTDFENIEIAPSKGNLLRSIDPQTVPYTKGAVYSNDEFYPGKLASLREPFIMRDIRGQSVDVYPVQYNPVTKVLRVYSDISVKVTNVATRAGMNEFIRQKKHIMEPQFKEMYENFFLNYNAREGNAEGRSYPTEEEGDLLIICHDAFMAAMKPYVNWKRSIGRKTTIVPTSTISPLTAANIKTYITDYYNNPDNNLAYVLLVGDYAQIPAHSYTNSASVYSIVTDNYLGQLTGNDRYMEVLIGRMSAETVAHVQTQVQRSIWYERDLTTADTWLTAAVGIASAEGNNKGHDGGEADYAHMNKIRTRLMNYGYNPVHQEYYRDISGIPNTSTAQISSRFNAGIGMANYCNHGNETAWTLSNGDNQSSFINYSTTHVEALQNAGKLPFIFSSSCLNGRFSYGLPCFAEAWMRATQSNQPTGAVATFMATISISWLPPMTAQDEFVNICMDLPSSYTGTQPGIKRTFAGAAINATQKMLLVHGISTDNTNDFDAWTVFGDPTLMIRTKTPQTMTVSHMPYYLRGAEFTVNCNVAGALATMSYIDENGDAVIFATAPVNAGVAKLTLNPTIAPNTVTLTIIARDKVTYIGEVTRGVDPTVTAMSINGTNISVAANTHYMAACGEDNIVLNLSSEGFIKVNGNTYTAGMSLPLNSDTLTINIESTGITTKNYTITASKALGSASSPMYIERWGKTLAVVNNPSRNGDHRFDNYRWFMNNTLLPGSTEGYILLNGRQANEYAAEVHSLKTGEWHKLCPNVDRRSQSAMAVYPNPVDAGSLLNINLPDNVTTVMVNFYNLSGNLVRQQKEVSGSVIAPNNTGLFIMEIQLPDGTKSIHQIIIK